MGAYSQTVSLERPNSNQRCLYNFFYVSFCKHFTVLYYFHNLLQNKSYLITISPPHFFLNQETSEKKKNPRGLLMLTCYIILQSEEKCFDMNYLQRAITSRCFISLLTFTCTLNMLQFIWEF